MSNGQWHVSFAFHFHHSTIRSAADERNLSISHVCQYITAVGQRRKRKLVRKLKASKTYEEWRNTATELDYALGFQEWKETDEDPKYDYPLIRKVRKSLVHLRSAGDVTGLMGVLEICLRNNFAGVEGVRMYSEVSQSVKPDSD